MKNKDIPEGGSKCVVLVDTCSLGSAAEKDLVLRKSVKAFTDSMLDLIVSTPETKEKVVDLLGRQELVYLGPDEQVPCKHITQAYQLLRNKSLNPYPFRLFLRTSTGLWPARLSADASLRRPSCRASPTPALTTRFTA